MIRAAAFKDSKAEAGHQPVRAAGKDAMRDVPVAWDKLDDVIDASFPASDPAAFNTRGVKRTDDRILKRAKRKFDEAKKRVS